MFTCSCCSNTKSYLSKKALYKHQKKFDPSYVDPADRDRVAYDSEPKLCECCNAPIPFEKRNDNKFCNSSCAATSNNRKRIRKYRIKLAKSPRKYIPRIVEKHSSCAVCGSPCSKICCSPACAASKRMKDFDKSLCLPISVASDQTWRRLLVSEFGRKCWSCNLEVWGNQPIPLQLDHIDGNSENRQRSNVRMLCCNCHALTPTFGARNVGNGRASRRKRYAEGKSY